MRRLRLEPSDDSNAQEAEEAEPEEAGADRLAAVVDSQPAGDADLASSFPPSPAEEAQAEAVHVVCLGLNASHKRFLRREVVQRSQALLHLGDSVYRCRGPPVTAAWLVELTLSQTVPQGSGMSSSSSSSSTSTGSAALFVTDLF